MNRRRSAARIVALTLTALTALTVLAGSTLAAAPARAAAPAGPAEAAAGIGHGWKPAPSSPFDQDAGVTCDFPIHGEPIVDQVRGRTLTTKPDGTPRSEIYTGALVIRLTNRANGRFYDVDAGGTAVFVYGDDGSLTWYVHGPVMIGFRENGGTLPRGQWRIDGTYVLRFAADGYKTLTMIRGTTDDICTRIA